MLKLKTKKKKEKLDTSFTKITHTQKKIYHNIETITLKFYKIKIKTLNVILLTIMLEFKNRNNRRNLEYPEEKV